MNLIHAPVYGTQRLVEAGQLVEVMSDFTAAPMPMSLLYPNRRQLAPRVQVLLKRITQIVTPYLMDTQAGSVGNEARRSK